MPSARGWPPAERFLHCAAPESKDPRPLSSKASYRKRHLVENFFERIKNFRRVATRCALDKYVSQRG
jgi:transposase